MVSTSTLDHDDKAFAFFKLPREVRDAIYGQPEMMDLIPLPQETEYQEVRAEITAVKLRESLLLISRQFNTEYREICEPQVGVRVSSAVGDVASTWSMVVPQEVAGKTRALHLHAGRWSAWVTMNQIVYWEGLYARLTDWSSQMPKLRAITVSLYKDVVHLRQKDVKVISDGIAKLLTVDPTSGQFAIIQEKSCSCSGDLATPCRPLSNSRRPSMSSRAVITSSTKASSAGTILKRHADKKSKKANYT
jgi:hypothetical protein